MKIDNTELWAGIFGLALSAFVVWSGYALQLGTIHDPGSGYVMFYAGLLMVLFSLIILLSAIKEGGPTFRSLWQNVLWTKPLIVIAALVVFTVLFEPLGFLISTTLLLIVLLRVIDPVPWGKAVAIAALVPLVCWYVLDKLLLIQLPSGLLKIG
ncbi:tripartite tricarboxylate transporter TctB [Afipia sp. P52-10]|uniref:tripartite tricarboxylate transporter TctB family protein n=1 Tax=Afipia sp. P52-10 TaxID=1429916 RepID=UPI0003DF0273|nr:tripartite tricarboxylate transporter TctB family protein [Afipia sp. P52-10]ETR76329.1 tripartite tricarboxylate transporter TctB [Afipia sp. P52-10]